MWTYQTYDSLSFTAYLRVSQLWQQIGRALRDGQGGTAKIHKKQTRMKIRDDVRFLFIRKGVHQEGDYGVNKSKTNAKHGATQSASVHEVLVLQFLQRTVYNMYRNYVFQFSHIRLSDFGESNHAELFPNHDELVQERFRTDFHQRALQPWTQHLEPTPGFSQETCYMRLSRLR